MTIIGIILAAGTSKRMGRPKALLDLNGKTFIRAIVDNHTAAGIEQIVVVLGDHAEEIGNEIKPLNVITAYNKEYLSGQLSSVHAGIKAVEQFSPDAILLHPVDHPLILPVTIKRLINSFIETETPIVVPVQQKRRGHPVIFASSLFPELLSAPQDIGARFVVRNHPAEITEVETGDPGIFMNIDTPEAYENI